MRSPELAMGLAIAQNARAQTREVIIASDDLVIESGDHVILFVIDKRFTRDIERLFQVGFTFF